MPDLALAPAYCLRPATAGDSDALYALHIACLKEYVAATWGWDDAIQQRMFRDQFAPERSEIVIVDGQIGGVIAVERRADDWFVANLAIDPALQGRGVGTTLLRATLTSAARDGVPTRLQVLRVNPARQLYERLGFVIENETPTHYQMVARGTASREGDER